MEENLFDIVPNFEELLINKQFDELNNREKNELSKLISSDDYDLLRKIILEYKSIEQTEGELIEPQPVLKQNLLKLIQLNQKQKNLKIINFTKPVLIYQIPVYQVAVLLIFITAAYFLFKPNQIKNNIVVNKIDTVYVDKQNNKEIESAVKEKPLTEKVNQVLMKRTHKEIKTKELSRNQYVLALDRKSINNIELMQTLRKGSSIRKDTMLEKLLYVAK